MSQCRYFSAKKSPNVVKLKDGKFVMLSLMLYHACGRVGAISEERPVRKTLFMFWLWRRLLEVSLLWPQFLLMLM